MALKCFLRYGYHGVSTRTIAKSAKVSLGKLYTYFPSKTEIYKSVLNGLAKEFTTSENALTEYMKNSDFPYDLEALAAAISQNVDRFKPYFKMVYIDVVEFNGKNIKGMFSNVYAKFNYFLGPHFKSLGPLGPQANIDPAFSFVAVYLQYYYLFALQKIFEAENVYGNLSEQETVRKIAELYACGLNRE